MIIALITVVIAVRILMAFVAFLLTAPIAIIILISWLIIVLIEEIDGAWL